MNPKPGPFFLCRAKNRRDAACRRLPRCRRCGRVLRFNERIDCHLCRVDRKGVTQ